VQILGLEYLRFADGLERTARIEREQEFQEQLLLTVAKAGLVASNNYKEEVLFSEYFPESTDEDEVDYSDNSGVDFEAPSEDEMDVLARMLANDSITIDGAPLEGPGAEQVSSPDVEEDNLPSLPPPRDFDPTQVEQDTEWV
jgi:hypothetical protein